jgi:hypothetical protein
VLRLHVSHICCSPLLQDDNNLVLYTTATGEAVWASNTGGQGNGYPNYAEMGGDGVLRVRYYHITHLLEIKYRCGPRGWLPPPPTPLLPQGGG